MGLIICQKEEIIRTSARHNFACIGSRLKLVPIVCVNVCDLGRGINSLIIAFIYVELMINVAMLTLNLRIMLLH